MRRVLVPAFGLLVSLLAQGCGSKTLTRVPVVVPICNAPQKLNKVGLCVDCVANADCAVGKFCNLITGTCQALPAPTPDAGSSSHCQVGAVRCAQDGRSVQTCVAVDGGASFETSTACSAGQVCNPQTLTCAVCIPGETTCDAPDSTGTYQRCKDDGTGFEPQDCNADGGSGFTCHQTASHVTPTDGGVAIAALATCQLCAPGSVSPTTETDGGGVGILTCDSTGTSESFTSCYPTGRYATNDGGPGGGLLTPLQCLLPICLPGDHKCDATANTSPARKSCSADGLSFVQDDCTGGDVCGPTADDPGACLSPCQIAEASTSYVGCDYWGAISSNTELDPAFTTNDQNGGSDFAFVVGNTSSTLTAHVSVANPTGGPPFNATVQPNQVAIIHLPWLQICGTGQAKYGFHLVADAPVTVYQFNPLTARRDTGNACSFGGLCASPLQTCTNNECFAGSYTADASLLLPTHLLGTSYVVVAQDHESVGTNGDESPIPALMTVMATTDNTTVSIRSAGTSLSTADSASACPGGTQGSLAGVTKGQTVQIPLNAGDVVQFWTKSVGSKTCSGNTNGSNSCVWDNDFTGSIVRSIGPDGGDDPTHKVAVFGGADCTFKPYNKFACDHIEEEMFPFSTWGKNYVGVKTHAYAGSTSTYPDFWRLVSGCGANSCPGGTTITISPPISNVRQQGICNTSGNVTTCHLPPVPAGGTAPWVEFEHNTSFVAHADQPAVLAQIFVSEDEAGQGLSEGDPSLVLTPPVEQWRSSYTVLAPTTYVHNYLNLMVQSQADTGAVSVDGAVVPAAEWSNIPGTAFYAAVHTLSNAGNGSHVISTTGGVKVGAVVYGYDSYISYGYTGGLDLQSITNINPGG